MSTDFQEQVAITKGELDYAKGRLENARKMDDRPMIKYWEIEVEWLREECRLDRKLTTLAEKMQYIPAQ